MSLRPDIHLMANDGHLMATQDIWQLLSIPVLPPWLLLLPKLNMCCLLESTCEWKSRDKLNGRGSGDYALIKLLPT